MAVEATDVLTAVCDYYTRPDLAFGVVDARRLQSPDSHWPIAEARGMLIYLWSVESKLSLSDMGSRLDRDPSTVWRLRRQIEIGLRERDVELVPALASLRNRIEELKQNGRVMRGDNGSPSTAA